MFLFQQGKERREQLFSFKKNKKRASCSPVSPGVVQLRKLVTGGEIPDMSVRFCTGGHFLGTKLRIRIVAPGYLAWS